MDTGRGASHTRGAKGGTASGWVGREGITWGEMPDIVDTDTKSMCKNHKANHSKPHCHVCTYAAILHVLYMYPETKMQFYIYIYERQL